jgi:hypothetical protein
MGMRAMVYELSADEFAECRRDTGAITRILASPGERLCWSLDKAWDGLHFLFSTGDYAVEASMLDFERGLVLGDNTVRLVKPQDVLELAMNFQWEGREEHLGTFYDPAAMAGRSPDRWQRDGDAALTYLLGFVDGLRKLTDAVADKQGGLLAVRSL